MGKADVFLGRRVAVYRIEEFLGEGGFAFVYRARDANLDIDVALKVLKPAFAYDDVFEENFRREAHRAAKFRHPNVIAIHYAGKEDDVVFFSMDLLHRGLKEMLDDGKPVDETVVIKVGTDVASALEFAHTHEGGIVHRDLKPDNILFDRHGNAVVTDFGIAEAATSYTAATGTTVYVGTPKYMSPEQARGQRVDGRSDIYSLGVTLYEMASGAAPFSGRDWFELGRKHIEEDPPLLREINPDIDPGLEQIILKCLEKDPVDRYQSAAALRADLSAVAGGTQPTVFVDVSRSRRTTSGKSPSTARQTGRRTDAARPVEESAAPTLPPESRRGVRIGLGVCLVLAGTLGAFAYDLGGFRVWGETRLPVLANVPVLGSGYIYPQEPHFKIVEGGADVGGRIQVAFSGPLAPKTVHGDNIALMGPDSTPLPVEIGILSENLISITPLDSLRYETAYAIVLKPGLVGMTRQPVLQHAGAAAPGARLTFRTRRAPPDREPPSLAESVPAADARTAPLDGPIVLTFNEPVVQGTVDTAAVGLYDPSGGRVAADIFCCSERRTAQLQPKSRLRPSTRYTIRFAGTIEDEAGNRMRPDSLVFRTGASATPAPAAPARLSVRVAPAEAIRYVKIRVDGKEIGNPPKINTPLEAGKRHTIELVGVPEFSIHELELFEKTVVPKSGEAVPINFTVKPFGSINVGSEPAGHVYVDGEYAGLTPLAGYPVVTGRHRLEIRPTAPDAGRYSSFTREFDIGEFEWKGLGNFNLPTK